MAEDREFEEMSLGELPEDIFKVKGYSYPKDELFYPGNMPADVGSSAPLADVPQVNEDRTRAASVRSTYDTRPINATDFHFTEIKEATPLLEGDEIVLFNYTVPESYVAVLRSFEYNQFPHIFVEDSGPLLSILIDGITQVGHSNIPVTADKTPFKTHIIAPEKSLLTLRLIYPAGYTTGIALSVWAHLYGNLLLTRNLPSAFEVGNDEPSKSIPVPREVGGERAIRSEISSQNPPRQSHPPIRGTIKRIKRKVQKAKKQPPLSFHYTKR